MNERLKKSVLLLAAAVVLSGCAGTTTNETVTVEPEVVESLKRYRKEYILAAGDQLEVVVYRSPELSRSVVVRPDGYISVPVLDDVLAAGLTVPELDRRLTELLSRRLLNPEVTVIVQNAREPMVYVFGEVGRATPIPLRQARTAAQALAHAGGVTRSGSKHVAVIRLNEQGRLAALLIEKQASGQPGFYMALQNTVLRPDDLIVVPESGRSQFIRFINDFINTPLSGFNSLASPYFQYRLIEEVED